MTLRRNDLGQYDDLAAEWWRPGGAFAMLHWIAQARAALIPPAASPDALLVDLGCGGGLLAPHAAAKGYRHVGVDLTASALVQAAEHGVRPVRGDAMRVPLRDACADVVSAGELLEHVPDPAGVVAEACRLLKPGGQLVLDTVNDTAIARLIVVRIGESVPGLAPRGIHDPNLFVPPSVVVEEARRHGVTLRVRGLRPSIPGILRFIATRHAPVRMRPTRLRGALYQAWGTREEQG